MPRHVPDDFSFLPTVDSTDDEIVAKETLWKSKPAPPPPESHEPTAEHYPTEELGHEEPLYEEPAYEEAAHEEPVYEEPAHEEPAHEEVLHGLPVPPPEPAPAPAPEPPVFVLEPQPAKKLRVFEPDAAHFPAEAEPGSKQAALKEKDPPAPPEKEKTPPIKMQMPKMPVPQAPAALAKPEGPVETPAHHTPKEVRLNIAPPAPVSAAKRLPTIDDEDAPAEKKKGKVTKGEEGEASADAKPFTAPKPPPEEPLDPDQLKKLRWKKLAEKIGLRTLGMSVGVHLFLLLVAAFITVTQVMDRQVDFLPGGSSSQSKSAAEALTHKVQNKKNPWLKAKPQQRKITVQSLSTDMVLPEMPAMDMMDFSSLNSRMDLSKAPSMGGGQPMGMGGAGGGLGAGIGRGGKFSFVGQTATGRRVVFVVDVSGSMSAIGQGERISRFELLKKELNKTLSQMPMGTAYQILFFSDFAWPHNEVDSRNSDAFGKYRWEIESKDYKKVKIPTFKYILASPFSVQDSKNIIQNADNPGGTNWGSGLLMALNANPKPDVIFFMTDGNRSDEMGWIDVVTAENKRKLPMTAIYTSAMQQPDAARELDTLAKRNNGRFTVVMGEGKVITGEDFFKMK